MFKASISILTPHTVHSGNAMCRSPKQAARTAMRIAEGKLDRFDRTHGTCSSIGGEWMSISKNGNEIFNNFR